MAEKSKISSSGWRFYAIAGPIIWLIGVIQYLANDGCIGGRWSVMCGNYAQLALGILFLFFMYFPYVYIFKILPNLKKEESLNSNLDTKKNGRGACQDS